MAITEVKTINELERLTEISDDNAFAISAGNATGSGTAKMIKTYLEQYLEKLTNKVNQITAEATDEQYPSAKAAYDVLATVNSVKPGTIIVWAAATPPEGYLLCDGSAISRETYADLFAVIGTTYSTGVYAYLSSDVDYFVNKSIPEVGDTIYDSDGNAIEATVATITETGFTDSAGASYTADSGNNKPTFNLPNTSGRFLKGGTAGVYNAESLPNITGKYNIVVVKTAEQGRWNASGAFYEGDYENVGSSGSDTNRGPLKFDASRSSSTYKNGAKVQPDNVEVSYCIKY